MRKYMVFTHTHKHGPGSWRASTSPMARTARQDTKGILSLLSIGELYKLRETRDHGGRSAAPPATRDMLTTKVRLAKMQVALKSALY